MYDAYRVITQERKRIKAIHEGKIAVDQSACKYIRRKESPEEIKKAREGFAKHTTLNLK